MHPTDASVLSYGMGQNLGSFPYFPISAPSHLISPPFCSNCSSRTTTKNHQKTAMNHRKYQDFTSFPIISQEISGTTRTTLKITTACFPSKTHPAWDKISAAFWVEALPPAERSNLTPVGSGNSTTCTKGFSMVDELYFFCYCTSTVTYSNYSNFIDYG